MEIKKMAYVEPDLLHAMLKSLADSIGDYANYQVSTRPSVLLRVHTVLEDAAIMIPTGAVSNASSVIGDEGWGSLFLGGSVGHLALAWNTTHACTSQHPRVFIPDKRCDVNRWRAEPK